MKAKPRARELGIHLAGMPGKHNAITDVDGVEVGYTTLILGEPSDYEGRHSQFARTGVTAILPKGKQCSAVFAGRHDLNGNGELTGTHWVDDSGFLHGPVIITNTYNVGIVRDLSLIHICKMPSKREKNNISTSARKKLGMDARMREVKVRV